MVALIVGFLMIGFTVVAALPPAVAGFGLGWGAEIILFLRGAAPVFSAFIGLIAVFIGIADMKDKADARKEEAEARSSEKKGE